MILTEVKRVLRERGAATIGEIAVELTADRAMVEAALQYWCGRGSAGPAESAAGPAACALGCPLCPHGAAASTAPGAAAYRWLDRLRASGPPRSSP